MRKSYGLYFGILLALIFALLTFWLLPGWAVFHG